jgi:hypothetical protein
MAMDSGRASDVFIGPDRVDHSEALGRPIRKGEPAQLNVSDTARVQAALQRHDFAVAHEIGAGLYPLYAAITGTFLEWCLALPAVLARDGDAQREPAITRESWRRWQEGISTEGGVHTPRAVAIMAQLLAPESLSPETVREYRALQAAGKPTRATEMLAQPDALYAEFAGAARKQSPARALSSFSAYVSEMRSRHDLAGEFVSTYAGVMQQAIGQRRAAAVMQGALESCALLESMWDAFAGLTPELLAAVLAEHLRGHFSGPGRQGSVTIIEESDRYRLVFEPCGTGGAMRRRKVAGLTTFREASAETWNRADEVPSYCAHCALNEVTSIERLGYPAWVTEFDPDPHKPCGWTVYKDPKLIPEGYFTRLGKKKV